MSRNPKIKVNGPESMSTLRPEYVGTLRIEITDLCPESTNSGAECSVTAPILRCVECGMVWIRRPMRCPRCIGDEQPAKGQVGFDLLATPDGYSEREEN